MHNHPSGDPAPSRNDVKATRIVRDAGEIIGIQLTDHVIIGQTYCSLKECGVFDRKKSVRRKAGK